MTTTINASTSAGLVQTADTSGILQLQTAGTTALTVDTSANVGIGTTSPVSKLSVANGSSGGFEVNPDGTGSGPALIAYNRNTSAYLQMTSSALFHVWQTSGTERMRIDSSGNVGIGTAVAGAISPSLRLGNSGSGGGVVTATLSLGSYSTGYGSNIISSSDFSTSSASYLAFGTTATGASGLSAPVERMRIDSSGNVGIGTSSPAAPLDVVTSSSANGISLRGRSSDTVSDFSLKSNDGASVYAQIQGRSTDLRIATNSTTPIILYTNSTERARIDSSGNLLVGTTSSASISGPAIKLVGGTDTGGANYTFYCTFSNNSQTFGLRNDGFMVSTAVYGGTTAVAANVNVESGGLVRRSTSALKYKQDIRDLEEIDINKFRPVRYKSKCEGDDQTKDYFGVIADEVEQAGIQELVTYGANGEVEGFQYERLTVVLLKSIQEQQALITQLQADVAALKGASA